MHPPSRTAFLHSRDFEPPAHTIDTRPGLLLVRCGQYVAPLAQNGSLRSHRLVAVDQAPTDVPGVVGIEDWPSSDRLAETYDFLERVVIGFGITHILAAQPGFWYSRLVEQVAAKHGLDLVWLETFFNGRIVLDRRGSVYTADNEIRRYAGVVRQVLPIPPLTTRLPQPPVRSGEFQNGIVVFGQVPSDMAVLSQPGLTYHQWLHALFTQNPDTQFLFKHHPQYAAAHLDCYPNVRELNAPMSDVLARYAHFAAFSSSTIIECVAARKSIVTGGYHALRGFGVTIDSAHSLDNIEARLTAHNPWGHAAPVLSFLYHHYSMHPSDDAVGRRTKTPSDRYFGT